jgi:hypothetical protein
LLQYSGHSDSSESKQEKICELGTARQIYHFDSCQTLAMVDLSGILRTYRNCVQDELSLNWLRFRVDLVLDIYNICGNNGTKNNRDDCTEQSVCLIATVHNLLVNWLLYMNL